MRTISTVINGRLIFVTVEDNISKLLDAIDTLDDEEIKTVFDYISSKLHKQKIESSNGDYDTHKYGVKLLSNGIKRIGVIKTIRTLNPGMGLKEAKELSDDIPSMIRIYDTRDEANWAVSELRDIGHGIIVEIIVVK